MADQPSDPHEGEPFPIDLSIARLARVENFLAGGDAHFAVDRAAAESIAEVSPGGTDGLRTMIDALKAFVERAVTALASEAGVVQFLHIGMATPTTGMVHHIASKIAPESRVVYVSWDPTTLAHVHSLGKDTGQVAVAHLQCSFDDPATILRGAAATLDFERPVAVILPTTLTLVPDDDTAQRILDELGAGIAPGSYLVFAHTCIDLAPEGAGKAIRRYNEILAEPYTARTGDQITRMLAGFDLVEPGLIPIELWRPDTDPPTEGGRRPVPIYGALARKPRPR
jgi:S-adenosyl methyltransferase